MDSAEARQITNTVREQNVRITHQEEFQEAMTAQMSQLAAQVQSLITFMQQMPKPTTETPIWIH